MMVTKVTRIVRTLLAVIVASLPAYADGLDLEIAPGFISSTNVDAVAPSARARAGYDTRWFTWSLSGMAALFADPGPLVHQRQGGGVRAWGLALEWRVHTEGAHGLFATLGLGFGQLTVLQAENGDTEGYRGAPAPYVEGAIGYRFVGRGIALGIELTLDIFNRVHLDGDLGTRFCVDEGGGGPTSSVQFCPMNRPFPLLGFAFTLGANTR